jgi:hypothetical protein
VGERGETVIGNYDNYRGLIVGKSSIGLEENKSKLKLKE